MTHEQATETLAEMIKQAISYDERGDTTKRQQVLRNIEDLPLPARYVRTALKSHGLETLYQG